MAQSAVPTPPSTGEELTRRDVLKTAWGVFAGLAALQTVGLVLAYVQPRQTAGEFGGIIDAGLMDDFPPGSVTPIKAGRFYLSRLTDGGFLAIFQRCTHLGCSVPWDQTQEMFVCPCHNSQFNAQGEVLNPPAPRALDLFPVRLQDGHILVDTGQVVTRQAFSQDQVVYP